MRAVVSGALLVLLGCAESAPIGACEPSSWIDEADPRAIALRASGVVAWDANDPPGEPIVLDGTLVSAEGDAATTLRFATSSGELALEIGLPRARLGVLPLGEPVQVTLGDGIVVTNAEGRIETAVLSRRGSETAVAANVTFRQSYAECVRATEQTECWRAMASPLVDVVTGASVIRLPPGGVWRIPNDEDPTVEIEIVRSIRAPLEGDVSEAPIPLCAEVPAQEIAAIIRHLR